MTYVADLHLHSSYARGTSPALSLHSISYWAGLKGIDLVATGDFTHPAWLRDLKEKLVTQETGLFTLAPTERKDDAGRLHFVLGTELSCVYPQGGRTRRVHLLVFAPDFAAVDRLCAALAPHGALESDGRPVLGLSARDVVEAALTADPHCEVVPAHAWTPWFSVYGSKGGFDSIAECFGDMLPHIHAIETGLSSDPSMNWRVPELDNMTIVSFSDAHSAPRLGRELTVFEGEPSYDGLLAALREHRVEYTVEFFPEEGKYHYDGHRRCGVCQHPSMSLQGRGRCPVCGRALTLGVLYKMESLAGRPEALERADDGMLRDPSGRRPPFRRLVPLDEIIAECLGMGVGAKRVRQMYDTVVAAGGSELAVLESAGFDQLASVAGERTAEAVVRVRNGEVSLQPGYDGVYGKVRVWDSAPVQGGPPIQKR